MKAIVARWVIAWLGAGCAAPALAHDLWIEPSAFAPRVGEPVRLRLRVGEHLAGDALPHLPARVIRFVVDDAVQPRPVGGPAGAEPAGTMRVERPGLHIVGYHSHPRALTLAADVFNRYLIDEGLESIAELRARRSQSGADAHEQFARCAKSLVLVGPPSEAQGDRRLGFPLELVAERNPYLLGRGGELPVRLTYQDRPLAGALVVALSSANPSDPQKMRSDADGRVHLRISPAGLWLVKAVHMVPTPAGSEAEWSSLWASLTFEGR